MPRGVRTPSAGGSNRRSVGRSGKLPENMLIASRALPTSQIMIPTPYEQMERFDHATLTFSQPVSYNASENETTIVFQNVPERKTTNDGLVIVKTAVPSSAGLVSITAQTNQKVELPPLVNTPEMLGTENEVVPAIIHTAQEAITGPSHPAEMEPKSIIAAIAEYFNGDGMSGPDGQQCLMKAFSAALTATECSQSTKPPAAEVGTYISEDKLITLETKIWIGSQERDLRILESDSRYLGQADTATECTKRFIGIMYKSSPEKIPRLCQQFNRGIPTNEQELIDPEIKEWLVYLIKKNYCNLEFTMRPDTPEPIRLSMEQAQRTFISNAITKGLYTLKQSMVTSSLDEKKSKKRKSGANVDGDKEGTEDAAGGDMVDP